MKQSRFCKFNLSFNHQFFSILQYSMTRFKSDKIAVIQTLTSKTFRKQSQFRQFNSTERKKRKFKLKNKC